MKRVQQLVHLLDVAVKLNVLLVSTDEKLLMVLISKTMDYQVCISMFPKYHIVIRTNQFKLYI